MRGSGCRIEYQRFLLFPNFAFKDIKNLYASASLCGNNRVVFNIGSNKYGLVVEVQYLAGIVWAKFIGTHEQYDKIDSETVNDY